MTDQTMSLEHLLSIVDGASPDAIEARVSEEPGGADAALDAAFEHVAASFNAGRAKSAKGVFQHDIAAPDGQKSYFVHVEDGTCEAGRGVDPDADLTIGIRLGDMLALATGKLSGDDAFKGGKLRLSGNPFLGMKLPEWFDAIS